METKRTIARQRTETTEQGVQVVMITTSDGLTWPVKWYYANGDMLFDNEEMIKKTFCV